jgi:hypothetical protein
MSCLKWRRKRGVHKTPYISERRYDNDGVLARPLKRRELNHTIPLMAKILVTFLMAHNFASEPCEPTEAHECT